MQVVYQSPQQLTLALFDGQPTYPLTLLRSRRHRMGDWNVHFHIIGESHAVIFTHHGRPLFTELLACIPVSAEQCAYVHPFTTLDAHMMQRDNYQVQVTFDATTPSPLTNSLELAFPPVWGRVPITRIEWEQTGSCLHWRTLHTYPNHLGETCVRTTSHFDFESNKLEGRYSL